MKAKSAISNRRGLPHTIDRKKDRESTGAEAPSDWSATGARNVMVDLSVPRAPAGREKARFAVISLRARAPSRQAVELEANAPTDRFPDEMAIVAIGAARHRCLPDFRDITARRAARTR